MLGRFLSDEYEISEDRALALTVLESSKEYNIDSIEFCEYISGSEIPLLRRVVLKQ